LAEQARLLHGLAPVLGRRAEILEKDFTSSARSASGSMRCAPLLRSGTLNAASLLYWLRLGRCQRTTLGFGCQPAKRRMMRPST
jgi:hypothetical protein